MKIASFALFVLATVTTACTGIVDHAHGSDEECVTVGLDAYGTCAAPGLAVTTVEVCGEAAEDACAVPTAPFPSVDSERDAQCQAEGLGTVAVPGPHTAEGYCQDLPGCFELGQHWWCCGPRPETK